MNLDMQCFLGKMILKNKFENRFSKPKNRIYGFRLTSLI